MQTIYEARLLLVMIPRNCWICYVSICRRQVTAPLLQRVTAIAHEWLLHNNARN